MPEEDLILGVWTREEFNDALLMAVATGVISSLTLFVGAWLRKSIG